MRIGIDIDDTTLDTVSSMIKYADIYDTSVLGRSGINGNFGLIENRYYLKALYGWNDNEKFAFFNMYYKNILEECSLIKDADNVIRKLKNDGHSIFFVTARLNKIQGCNIEKITIDSLNKNNIPYDEVIISASDKLKVCKEKNIDLFIEDSYETCTELSNNNITSILMTTKMNEKIDSGNILRVYNWNEVYDKIKEISKY